jgi:hypothetical protein
MLDMSIGDAKFNENLLKNYLSYRNEELRLKLMERRLKERCAKAVWRHEEQIMKLQVRKQRAENEAEQLRQRALNDVAVSPAGLSLWLTPIRRPRRPNRNIIRNQTTPDRREARLKERGT